MYIRGTHLNRIFLLDIFIRLILSDSFFFFEVNRSSFRVKYFFWCYKFECKDININYLNIFNFRRIINLLMHSV